MERIWMIGLPLLVLTAACASAAPDPSVTTAQTVPTTAITTTTVAPSTTEEPTTSTTAAADSVPPDLAGRWFSELDGERLILSLNETTYAISFGNQSPGGKVSVDGNQIRFYAGRVPGDGLYEWTVDGETLTFTALEPDPSSGRQAALETVFMR